MANLTKEQTAALLQQLLNTQDQQNAEPAKDTIAYLQLKITPNGRWVEGFALAARANVRIPQEAITTLDKLGAKPDATKKNVVSKSLTTYPINGFAIDGVITAPRTDDEGRVHATLVKVDAVRSSAVDVPAAWATLEA